MGRGPERGDREGRSTPRDFRTGRLEAFSDGVFAIAITLLVLEITIPVATGDGLLDAVLDEWPSYLAYVVSFSTVGATWLAHSAITEYLDHATIGFIRLNLVLLLVVSFIPFPTKLASEYIGDPDAERVAVTVYGLTLLAAVVMVTVLWRYAAAHGLVIDDALDDEVRSISQRTGPGVAAYAVLIAVGLFFPIAAVIGYLVIALLFIFPLPRVVHGVVRRGRSR